MKFFDGWQVDVLRPNDAGPYADIPHGSEKYVVGIPDQPFEVKVTAPPSRVSLISSPKSQPYRGGSKLRHL